MFILSIYIPDRDEKQETSEQMDERIYKGLSFQFTKIQQILQIYKSFYKKIDIFFARGIIGGIGGARGARRAGRQCFFS